MRVTKTVKEYITKEVSTRIHKKYEEEEARAKYEVEQKNKLYDACIAAAEAAIKKVIDENKFDFIETDNKIGDCINFRYNTFTIKNQNYTNSCHKWRSRFNAEVDEKVNEIVVELELGGDRAKLTEMLNAL